MWNYKQAQQQAQAQMDMLHQQQQAAMMGGQMGGQMGQGGVPMNPHMMGGPQVPYNMGMGHQQAFGQYGGIGGQQQMPYQHSMQAPPMVPGAQPYQHNMQAVRAMQAHRAAAAAQHGTPLTPPQQQMKHGTDGSVVRSASGAPGSGEHSRSKSTPDTKRKGVGMAQMSPGVMQTPMGGMQGGYNMAQMSPPMGTNMYGMWPNQMAQMPGSGWRRSARELRADAAQRVG